MRALASIVAFALASAAAAQERAPLRPGTVGDAPVAPAGSQAAPLRPDEALSNWRYALAAGVAGKFGGLRLESAHENRSVLLYFGGQADGVWTEGHGQAARLRARFFTGGESALYAPSDGDVEAAYMLGRREFRFVVGRVELSRHPALALQVLAQAGTLPSFEGTVPLAWDTMRLTYLVAPVEAAWVYYFGGAHLASAPGRGTESDRISAATAARLRYVILLPASVLLSLEGDLLKMWHEADLFLSVEGTLGYQVLQRSTAFNVVARWSDYSRRGPIPRATANQAEFMLLGVATLAF